MSSRIAAVAAGLRPDLLEPRGPSRETGCRGRGAQGSAIAFLQAQDQAVREILAASPSDSLSAEHRLQVKERINLAFDFVELARLSLGDHWEGCSAEERTEFVETFRRIVEERNLDSFVRYYREGGIEYQGEETARRPGHRRGHRAAAA